jgi:hypothetical protein
MARSPESVNDTMGGAWAGQLLVLAKSVGVSTASVVRVLRYEGARFQILRVFLKAYLPEVHIYEFHCWVMNSVCGIY